MEHHLNVEIAKKYGVLEALLLYNILFWVDHNAKNGKNYYDGHYWTFNSSKAYAEQFPYFSQEQIKRLLKSLKQQGAILVGEYNKAKFDHTKWYTVTNDVYDVLETPCSIVRNRPIDSGELPNGECETTQAIPDINTDNKQDTTTIEDFSANGHVVVVKDKGCKELDELISFWSNNIHPIVKYEADELICLYQEAGYSNVLEAMKIAVTNHRKNMGYVKQTAYNLADGVDFRNKKKEPEPEKPKKTEAELEAYRRTEEYVKRLKTHG